MIIGTIVTYNPDLQDLERNIIAIRMQLDRLVIFDNQSLNISELDELCLRLDVEIIKSDQNIGLGAAYNTVINKYKGTFDYFVTFDQDTFLSEHVIERLIHLFDLSTNVGIVGPSFVKKTLSYRDEYSETDYLIQSCSIFPKKVFEVVGIFNEKLFIDSVDFEYCLRVLLNKFKILRSNRVFIEHNLGDTKKRYGISYIQHSALRNYFISRNHKYLTLRYLKHSPYFILRKNFFFIVHIMKLIILDQDPEKIRSIIRGLRDNVS